MVHRNKEKMTLKKIFENAFGAYKKNFPKLFLPLLVLELVMLLPMMFFTMPGTVNAARALLVTISSFSETGSGSSAVFYVLGFILLALLFFSPLVVSNTVYVVDKDYDKKDVAFRDSFCFSRKNYGSMIKAYFAGIIGFLPVIGVVILLVLPVFPYTGVLSGLDVFLIVVAVIVALFYVLGTIFVPYVVVTENKSWFAALKKSFRYIYKGNFFNTLGRLALCVLLIGVLVMLINWLSQLPFDELFYLYLKDPLLALQEPLMIFAIIFSLVALLLIALIMPFWYAFSYNTYRGAKIEYEVKYPPEAHSSGYKEKTSV